MGLKDILTKPLFADKNAFVWNEPKLFRHQLRGDLIPRISLVVSAWLIGTGVMLFLFSLNRQPPSFGMAVGFGIVIGFGPGFLAFFSGRQHVAGRVYVRGSGIERRRTYRGRVPLWMITESGECPYEAIDHFALVSGHDLDMPFSVMVVEFDGEHDIYGVPESVDLRELGRYLRSLGVSVSRDEDIPEEHWVGLPPISGIVAPFVGLAFLSFGLVLYLQAIR